MKAAARSRLETTGAARRAQCASIRRPASDASSGAAGSFWSAPRPARSPPRNSPLRAAGRTGLERRAVSDRPRAEVRGSSADSSGKAGRAATPGERNRAAAPPTCVRVRQAKSSDESLRRAAPPAQRRGRRPPYPRGHSWDDRSSGSVLRSGSSSAAMSRWPGAHRPSRSRRSSRAPSGELPESGSAFASPTTSAPFRRFRGDPGERKASRARTQGAPIAVFYRSDRGHSTAPLSAARARDAFGTEHWIGHGSRSGLLRMLCPLFAICALELRRPRFLLAVARDTPPAARGLRIGGQFPFRAPPFCPQPAPSSLTGFSGRVQMSN